MFKSWYKYDVWTHDGRIETSELIRLEGTFYSTGDAVTAAGLTAYSLQKIRIENSEFSECVSSKYVIMKNLRQIEEHEEQLKFHFKISWNVLKEVTLRVVTSARLAYLSFKTTKL